MTGNVGLFINYCVISIGTIPLKLFAGYNIKDSHILVIAQNQCISYTDHLFAYRFIRYRVSLSIQIFSALSIICLK